LKKTIKIEDIKRYIDDGIKLKVIDNVTGKDITVQTMVSVLSSLAEDAKGRSDNVIIQLLLKKGADVMDVIKKLMLAAIGAVSLSKERMEEMLDELVKKGEMTSGEKAEALKKMAEKVESSTEKVKEVVEKQVKSAIEKINIGSRIDELSRKVDDLSKAVDKLRKKIE
jgi:poly(hydroxyalkanoate) granule-associated protein